MFFEMQKKRYGHTIVLITSQKTHFNNVLRWCVQAIKSSTKLSLFSFSKDGTI